ncbi:MAG: CHASE domain-containing protein, partial [Candidatus Aquirickettsiella gammari]
MCFASSGTWWLNLNEKTKLDNEFNNKSERLSNEIEQRLSQQIYGLNGVKSLFGVDENLSAAAFHTAINTHKLTEEYPGVRGIGFIEKVDKSDLDAYIAHQKKDLGREFSLQEFGANPGQFRYLLKYFETPFGKHFVAGSDFGSDTRRLTAIEEAINSGLPSMTPLMYAPPKTEMRASIALFVPVYKNGASLKTPEER